MKLTVVTICYNDLNGLKTTIDSLRKQTCFDFEHWIVDGASKDGTPDYLRSLQVPWDMHFISEKDRGIYHAMNKGAARATGEFVWFLNSGDFCADETCIDRWKKGLRENPEADLLYGQVWFRGEGFEKSVGSPVSARDFWSGMPLGHQGIIYRRSFLAKNPYREDLRIVSDWILTEWFFENTRTAFVPGYFAIFNLEGVSAQNLNKVLAEKFRAEKRWLKKLYLALTLGLRFSTIGFLRKIGVYPWIQSMRYRRNEVTSPPEKNT